LRFLLPVGKPQSSLRRSPRRGLRGPGASDPDDRAPVRTQPCLRHAHAQKDPHAGTVAKF